MTAVGIKESPLCTSQAVGERKFTSIQYFDLTPTWMYRAQTAMYRGFTGFNSHANSSGPCPVAYRGRVQPPSETPKALQNRAELNPTAKTVKNS